MTTVALIEPQGLLGAEVRDRLASSFDLGLEILLRSRHEDTVGTLTDLAGAAAMVQTLTSAELADVDLVILCEDDDESISLLNQLPAGVGALVLGAADDRGLLPVVAGINDSGLSLQDRLSSPHSAAVVLAHLLDPLSELGLQSATATLLQPISVHDTAALDEVFEQTKSLLAFQSVEKKGTFGAQLAFNLLPSGVAPEVVENPLRHLLGEELEVHAHLVQAGVFHSLSVSLHVDIAEGNDEADVVAALESGRVVERAEEPQTLGPLDVANRDEILIGDVMRSGAPGSFWIWAVMDNLTRGGALNAVEIVRSMLRNR